MSQSILYAIIETNQPFHCLVLTVLPIMLHILSKKLMQIKSDYYEHSLHYYLHQGGYVVPFICLSVCLSVC